MIELIKKYKCDGCGREIKKDEIFQIQVNSVVDDDVEREVSYSDALAAQHYCPECMQELFYSISQFKKNEKKYKTILDPGKCYALKEAGWTYKQIYDEFGGKFSQSQIKKAIKEYVPKEEEQEEGD